MEIVGQNIIIFGLPRFDSKTESTNYTIAKLLARDNSVYYIENPFTIKDYFKFKNEPEYQVRKDYFSIGNIKLIDTDIAGLKIIIPPIILSINFLPEGFLFRCLLKVNEFLIRKKLKKIIFAHKISNFIFINSFNFHYPNISKNLFPRLTVYHCVDPIIMPFDIKHGLISEGQLIRESDLVLCTSKQLYKEHKLVNNNTFFVPNAADITLSLKALDESLPIASVLRNISQPIIGYFGNIERRIDYPMMKEVIHAHPDKSFVFIGPQSKEYIPDWFFNTSNLHLIDRVPYSEMPAVLKGFDVALLPFKRDEVSATIFPLKLFEYLGAGKPVISINFNDDLLEFTGDTVSFCSNARSFSDAITDAIVSNNEIKKQNRINVAANNTWHTRIDQIKQILSSELVAKSEGSRHK